MERNRQQCQQAREALRILERLPTQAVLDAYNELQQERAGPTTWRIYAIPTYNTIVQTPDRGYIYRIQYTLPPPRTRRSGARSNPYIPHTHNMSNNGGLDIHSPNWSSTLGYTWLLLYTLHCLPTWVRTVDRPDIGCWHTAATQKRKTKKQKINKILSGPKDIQKIDTSTRAQLKMPIGLPLPSQE